MRTKLFNIMFLLLALNLSLMAAVVDHDDVEKGFIKDETSVFEDDYIYIGKGLNFKGESEDLYFMGKSLNFKGKTKYGIIGFGKEITINGPVGNGIISGSKDIVIKDTITGTSFIAGKDFKLHKDAVLNGDLFSGAGEITIDGTINGNIYLGAGKIDINGVINGDVKIYGGRIKISESGKINGNLTYGTKEKLSEEELSRVTGDVRFDDNPKFDNPQEASKAALAAFGIFFALICFFSFIISGSILLALPISKNIEEKRTDKTYLHTALWGLIPIFSYAAVIVISIMMIITIPFAIVLVLAALPLFFIAHIIGTTMAGQYLSMKFKWNVEKRHYHFLIGSGAGLILSIIPFIDVLAFLAISGLGWGMLVSFLFNKKIEVIELKK